MSGIEVVGLIASIIAITDAIVKVYAATKTASGLPEAFYDVATRLPLVRNTISEYLNNTNPDEQSCEATKAVLRSCEDRAKKLEKIFKDVISQANPSTTERFLLAVHTLGKGGRVESLMKGIQEDVQLLTGYHVTKLATQASIAAVREHISALLLHGIHPPATAETERDFLLKELKWTDPTIDKGRIERTKGGLYEDSSCWILSHPNYKDWKDGKTKLLWVKGGAGKGKTMLLIAITKQLRSQTRLDHPVANSSLSFFFCQNTDDRLNNAVAILKGLIYLLLVQDVSLVSYLKSDCDRMGKDIFDVTSNNVNAFDALSNVFRQMIQHSRSETMYLAVDALDECKDGLPDLLKLVRETALQENRLKWILTSRNRVDIEENLALDSPGARLSLEVNSEAVSQAIETYIIHKVAQVSSLRSSPIQRTNIQQKLLEKAEGTFLWVDLVLRSIYTLLADEAVRCIDKTPPGLLPLYDQMMGDVGKFASDYRDSCLTVLSVATLAYRPLHILELRTLAGLEYETADLERIVDMCGSFLTLVDSHVYPIHQSAKDYLASDVAAKKIFQSGKCAVQRNIVDRSIVAMEKTLRRDVYQLVHPGALSREVEARPPTLDPLLGVGYSCTYWIDHVCETDKADLQGSRRYRIANTLRRYVTGSKKSIRIRDLIEAFFHDHFLHWLEALSLLGVISNGVLSLARLRTIIEARMDAFMDLVEDIYRFILLNQWLVEQAPLQTYISALLFTPTDSIIRRIFAKEEPGWVLTKPVVEQVWNLCLQTFEGHSDSVRSVAFSPDGSRVASGSDDRTIRIWDARSGKEVQKLEGHSNWVWSVAFSPDGSRVASGSGDTTIRIWDARSGKEVQKLEGHSDSVLSVAFSPDGSRVASGSGDTTIRIWDARSGKEVQKLEGHSDSVLSVAFSPDGSRVASGSGDRTIRIWDARSGKEVQKLEGHSDWVLSVAFSPDGSRVASGSGDTTIRIWDARSGKEVQKLEGHSDWVRSVAFSPDGSRVASGSGDTTIRIWDARSGKEVQKLEGHSDLVRSVAFSPDGSRVASGSDDRTIRIWDARSGKEVQKLEGHSNSVRSVAFSPDGSRVASGSGDRTIRIWDARSGKEVQKLEGHSDSVLSVAFSPDGSRVASGSGDTTIRIWDARSGKEVQKLEGHSDWVRSVAFSPDGSRVASGSDDRTIRIWDARSGKEVQKLEGHSNWVWSVAFSPDGSRVASGSDDTTIRIWDARSGKEVQKLEGRTPNFLRFEDLGDSGLWLRTGAGSIKLEDGSHDGRSIVADTSRMINSNGQSTSNPQTPFSGTGPRWDLGGDGSWVTWRGQGSIWLPPDFRPGVSDISGDGSAIAIGRRTGRVVVLRMSMEASFP
ncbi:WD40-repeat-containing domain protein [Lasiosphaeria hispida]|uniref:Mitochondrial division protein 1 n=1 Tax=Lasiosphaeria hispida TaxID=260671 RepID=A0AAJ0HFP6_9PEZI|nr:WD40-repeat-containing domain protein [Lasiosphaeria hispida]